jgi:hypothetical protein
MTGYDDLSGREDPFALELAAAVERALPGRHGERPGPRLRHTVRS